MNDQRPVIYTESGKVLRARLNAEASLNSLTLEMVDSLYEVLSALNHNFAHDLVFLEGSGTKAFCAGGDIRKLYKEMTTPGSAYPETFFEHEYRTDYTIHTSQVPVLAWGHGIVMGGGLGVMSGAKYRIVTESTMLAMPEITIGLYPDVGASYFLNRSPHPLGLFCGLTGVRLNAHDTKVLGLGDYFIKNEYREDVFQSLCHKDDETTTESILKSFEEKSLTHLMPSELQNHRGQIESIIGDASSIIDIAKRFEKAAAQSPWIEKAYKNFSKGSPLSAHFILQQLKTTKKLSLKECFVKEIEFSIQFSRHNDFPEGVRALLIDKDNNPRWQFSSLESVDPKVVNEHFICPYKNPQDNPLLALT